MANIFQDWGYGYEIDIANQSATDGFQAILNLSYLPGMRADFRDIRFADKYGTELKHYRESYTAFSTARFWVRLPANDTKILLYYGNGSVTTASSAADTFDFFDDFDSLNSSRWATVHGSASVSNSVLTVASSTLNSIVESVQTFAPNTIVEARAYHAAANKSIIGYRNTSTQKACAWHGTVSGDASHRDYMFSHTGSVGKWVNDGVARGGTTYYIYGTAHIVSGPRYYVNYIYRGTNTENIPGNVNLPIHFYSLANTGNVCVDWVRVRKYAATEPTLTLGKKFVQSFNVFLQQHDYIFDGISTYSSVVSSIKDTFQDFVSTSISTGFSIGPPDEITDEISTVSSITNETIVDKIELRDYSLVSCNISKSITDAYMQLSADFADVNVPDEESTVKYYAHLPRIYTPFSTADGLVFTTADGVPFGTLSNEFIQFSTVDSYLFETLDGDIFGFEGEETKTLLFWGKVVTNSPEINSYYDTLQMQAADNSRNLSVQKIPWNYQVISLSGAYSTWPQWISALIDYDKTGVIVKRIIDAGMPDKQFVFRPETTRLEAINEICSYCGLTSNIKLVEYEGNYVPGFYAVPASQIDNASSGFDLPDPIEFDNPDNYNILTSPKIEGMADEKYNMVTVYGTISSTGETTVASVYTPSVEEGTKAREYRIQDNSIEEKGSTAEIEAIKWLLYFNAPRATVSVSFLDRFDFELYQRIRFGSAFSLKLRELTNSVQLPYIVAYDPRDELNSKHTIDVSGVPRPSWLRISELGYRSTNLKCIVELKLITDYIYSSTDPVISEDYSQYISPGYLKPVSDDSVSTIQNVVDSTIAKQLGAEVCTLLSVDSTTKTGVVKTESGNTITVPLPYLEDT